MESVITRVALTSAALGAVGMLLVVLLVAGYRRWRRGRSTAMTWIMMLGPLAIFAVLGLASFALLALAPSSSSTIVSSVTDRGTQVLRVERTEMPGHREMRLEWSERGKLHMTLSAYYVGGTKVATVAVEKDAIGFRGEDGRNGPWLYLQEDGKPDLSRSGWYEEDKPLPRRGRLGLRIAGSIQPLDQEYLDDLLHAWETQ
jgi:hypothetical protein